MKPVSKLLYQFTFLWLLLFSSAAMANPDHPGRPIKKKIIVGYVSGYRGLINTAMINPLKITHINYAFVDIRNNRAWLRHQTTDSINFRKLNLLKKVNPNLKILLSVGGWAWSNNFSDAVLTDTSRKAFAASAVALVGKYGVDGIDIDWEYPGLKGAGNVFRPEDKENYTLMFRYLRESLDSLQLITHKRYQLTTAVGAFPNFVKNTDMGAAQQYLDYISLMTYDYMGNTSAHHTNLFPSNDYEKENSAHKAVIDFMAAGVPVNKLLMGIAFYGRGWNIAAADKHGYNQKIVSNFSSEGYTFIKDSLMHRKGFKTYWDSKAKAPYLFNYADKLWISYDNERSVKLKCKYVKEHKMGGVMFWEYSADMKDYLLNTIDRSFR